MRKRYRLKLLVAYFVASLVALWAPESLLCRVMFVLATIPALVYWVEGAEEREVLELRNLLFVCPLVFFLSHYPSIVNSRAFGFTLEEQSQVFGRLHGRGGWSSLWRGSTSWTRVEGFDSLPTCRRGW